MLLQGISQQDLFWPKTSPTISICTQETNTFFSTLELILLRCPTWKTFLEVTTSILLTSALKQSGKLFDKRTTDAKISQWMNTLSVLFR